MEHHTLVQFMMLWSALVFEGDATFDNHQLEDFLQMCVMISNLCGIIII